MAHNIHPNVGIWQRIWEPSGNLALEASGIWLQNMHRTGKTDSWSTQTKLCKQGPRRKERWPHKRLTQTLPVSVQEFPQRHGSTVACCRVRDTECGSACMRPFEGGHCYLHYLHHSLISGLKTGREQSLTHQQKIGLNIYWTWLLLYWLCQSLWLCGSQ